MIYIALCILFLLLFLGFNFLNPKKMKLKNILKLTIVLIVSQTSNLYCQSVSYEAENLTKGGPYTGNITSPFTGIGLYGNGDFANGTAILPTVPGLYDVLITGASSATTAAGISLEVEGVEVGSYSFTGTTATVATKQIKILNGSSSRTFKLILKTDTGANDTFIDKITFTYAGVIPPPRNPPVIPALGAVASGNYRNMFIEAGYTKAQVDAKVTESFQKLFYGNPDATSGEAVYYPVGTDEAYILDTGNGDVRSEGMSYGMMICVQLNKQTEFNRLWKWANNHMRHTSVDRKGLFAWQCNTDGTIRDPNTASDGEEYFATSLFFAAKRWGNGTGIFNYEKEANSLLVDMQNKSLNGLTTVFNTTEKQVVFVPNGSAALFTDPSYHLPAFYEVWAKSATTNNQFWSDVATKSRAFFPTTAHPTTGLMPDYAKFNGQPEGNFGTEHADFRFDAFRCIMNIAVDYAWYKKSDTEKVLSKRIQSFFNSKGITNYPNTWKLDGTPTGTDHSPGLVACNAVGALASDNALAWDFIDELYKTNTPSGRYRYYDGLLYMMSLLHVSGQFKAYIPGNLGLADHNFENLNAYPNPANAVYNISNNSPIDKVEISNIVGQNIFSQKYSTTAVTIDFSNFKNGVYMVTIHSEGKEITSKVIKD
jgi:endo-1,4-beta-D-glucanase Y